jgi:hypothetical protein
MRDIKDAYRLALVEEYEGYQRAGRDADAQQVAEVLLKHYGVDVAPKKTEPAKPEPAKPESADVDDDAPERADAERPPEDTAKPPAKRGPGRPRKPAQG